MSQFDPENTGEILLTRREVFAASHRLHSPHFSDIENRELFGKCNYPNGHGHNYELFVTVKGKCDPKTGMIMNLVELKEIMLEHVIDKVDHYHMNHDVPEFKNGIPSCENMAILFWNWLEPHLPKGSLYEIKLVETENNYVIYRGKQKAT